MLNLEYHPTYEQVVDIMNEYDDDGNGTIDVDEFLTIYANQMEEDNYELDMDEAFEKFDSDGNELISAAEYKQAMDDVGEGITDEDVNWVMREEDKDGDGHINYDEFVRMMNQER